MSLLGSVSGPIRVGHFEFSPWRSISKPNRTVEAWLQALDAALRVYDEFTVHPNAVYSPDAFGVWLRRNGTIGVIRGRRAALMVISDSVLAAAATREFGTHVSNPNNFSSQVLKEYHALTARNLLPAGPTLARHVREAEACAAEFDRQLNLSGTPLTLQYHYEDLLLPGREAQFARLLQFAHSPGSMPTALELATSAFPQPLGEPVTLHPVTCSSRVDDWAAMRPYLQGTDTLRACDRLESRRRREEMQTGAWQHRRATVTDADLAEGATSAIGAMGGEACPRIAGSALHGRVIPLPALP